MPGRRSWRALTWSLHAALVAAGATLGCGDLLGPDRESRPLLRTLEFDDLTTSLRQGGLLYVNGYPSDTTFRLGARQRVPVEIRTSAGDRERAGLFRLLCPPRERGAGFHCFSFILLMQSGRDASEVAPRVAAMGGRYHVVSSSGAIAGVTLFDSEDLVRRARSARQWPGVSTTELSFPFCAQPAPGCLSLSDLTVPMPVDTGPAATADGIVQIRSGDTVVVSYSQPAGSVLQAFRVVP